MKTSVILADGTKASVRRLGLFELRDAELGPADPGDFLYTVQTVAGTTYQAVYDLHAAVRNPPQPPTEEAGAWALTEWERFHAAMAHHQRRLEIAQEYEQAVADYILAHCVEPDVRGHLTAADYLAIAQAALCPQLSIEDLAGVLDSVFPGQI